MRWVAMQTKAVSAVLTALLLAGCAATTPRPPCSAVSPADPNGPESVTPPPSPGLASEPEAQSPSPVATPPVAESQAYTCPMHAEILQASPGSCPKCAMTLVRRKDAGSRP